jgi:hypothetical protein
MHTPWMIGVLIEPCSSKEILPACRNAARWASLPARWACAQGQACVIAACKQSVARPGVRAGRRFD